MSAIAKRWLAAGSASGAFALVLVLAVPFGFFPQQADNFSSENDPALASNTLGIDDTLSVNFASANDNSQATVEDTSLSCEIQSPVQAGATVPVSWHLTSVASLAGIEGKVVVLTIPDTIISTSAVTDQNGYAEGTMDLEALNPGKYMAYGFFDGDESYAQSFCTVEFELIQEESTLQDGATQEPAADPSNGAPMAQDDSATTRINTAVLIDVLANDSDPDNDYLTVVNITDPPNGSITNEGEGLIRYIPNANFFGNDAFEYTISDGRGGESTAQVSIGVFRSSGGSATPPATECSDTTLPSVEITSPASGSLTLGPSNGVWLNIAGTASDNSDCGFDKVQVAILNLDSGKVTRWYRQAVPTGSDPNVWSEWTYQFKVYEEANYRIVARAFDNAGNIKWASTITEVGFDSDATQPKVAIVSPANGEVVSTGGALNIQVSGTSFDAMSGVQKVEVRTHNTSYQIATPNSPGDWSTWTHDRTLNAFGTHTLVARATDSAGNMGWFVIEIEIT